MDEEGSSREKAAAQSVWSADQHREGGDDADGESHQAAGTAASESSSSGVQRDETSGLPESEHTGGDDTRDEEAEGGDGGRRQRAGREQPLLREIRHSDAGRRAEGLKVGQFERRGQDLWRRCVVFVTGSVCSHVHTLCVYLVHNVTVRWSFFT